MAGFKMNALITQLFTHWSGSTQLPKASGGTTSLYVGLMTVPTDTAATISASAVGNVSEASYSGYARVQGAWTANGTTNLRNNTEISFTAVAGATVYVCGIGLYDTASTGNLLYYGPLTGGNKTILVGDTPKISVNALTLAET